MGTDGPMPMNIEGTGPDALLTLAQWFSPGFPVGAYSYSHGLEWAVQTGEVQGAEDFRNWLTDVLRFGAGRNDLILLAAAYRAVTRSELTEIDALARALSPSAERLLETAQQGAGFARTASAIWGLDLPDLTYPVALGSAAKALAIPIEPTAQLYLHAFAANLTSAAIRLIPLGQTEGHGVLAALAPVCIRIVDGALQQSLDDLGSTAFLVDVSSMRHETQYSRMFRS